MWSRYLYAKVLVLDKKACVTFLRSLSRFIEIFLLHIALRLIFTLQAAILTKIFDLGTDTCFDLYRRALSISAKKYWP